MVLLQLDSSMQGDGPKLRGGPQDRWNLNRNLTQTHNRLMVGLFTVMCHQYSIVAVRVVYLEMQEEIEAQPGHGIKNVILLDG